MAVTYAPTNATIYETIRQWIKTDTGYADTSVYWSHQPVDQSPLPRIVLSVVSDLQRGLPERRYENHTGNTLIESMVAYKELIVSVEAFTLTRADAAAGAAINPATDEAIEVLRKLLSSIGAASTLAQFTQAQIEDVSDVRDLTELEGSTFERRAQCDLTIGYNQVRADDSAIPIDTFAAPTFNTQ